MGRFHVVSIHQSQHELPIQCNSAVGISREMSCSMSGRVMSRSSGSDECVMSSSDEGGMNRSSSDGFESDSCRHSSNFRSPTVSLSLPHPRGKSLPAVATTPLQPDCEPA